MEAGMPGQRILWVNPPEDGVSRLDRLAPELERIGVVVMRAERHSEHAEWIGLRIFQTDQLWVLLTALMGMGFSVVATGEGAGTEFYEEMGYMGGEQTGR
jgi:hypothetical protein